MNTKIIEGIASIQQSGVTIRLSGQNISAQPRSSLSKEMALWLVQNKAAVIEALRINEQPVERTQRSEWEAQLIALAKRREAGGLSVNWEQLNEAIPHITDSEFPAYIDEIEADTLHQLARWQLVKSGRVIFESGSKEAVISERARYCSDRLDAKKKRVVIRQNPELEPLALNEL